MLTLDLKLTFFKNPINCVPIVMVFHGLSDLFHADQLFQVLFVNLCFGLVQLIYVFVQCLCNDDYEL